MVGGVTAKKNIAQMKLNGKKGINEMHDMSWYVGCLTAKSVYH